MKTLYLLRHCIALTSSASGDEARALAPKGEEDAAALGKVMAQKGYIPSFALCSPSKRTRQTLIGMGGKAISNILYPDILYNGTAGDLLAEIQKIPAEVEKLLVLAHNPGVHALAGMLAGAGSSSHIRRLMQGYNPGTLSVLSCPCENWADLQPDANVLENYLDPLDYNAPARPTRWT